MLLRRTVRPKQPRIEIFPTIRDALRACLSVKIIRCRSNEERGDSKSHRSQLSCCCRRSTTNGECEAFQPTIVLSRRDNLSGIRVCRIPTLMPKASIVLSRRDNEESVTAESNVSMIVKILPQNNFVIFGYLR